MTTVSKTFKNQLVHNRKMLNILKNFKFSKPRPATSHILPTEELPVPMKKPTKLRDIEELNDIKSLCNDDVNQELPEDLFNRFNIYIGAVSNNRKAIIDSYIEDVLPNTNFKLRFHNRNYKISYRNNFFYDLSINEDILLSMTTEHVRLLYGFRQIKNTIQLSSAQMNNSIKMIGGGLIGWKKATLHTLI